MEDEQPQRALKRNGEKPFRLVKADDLESSSVCIRRNEARAWTLKQGGYFPFDRRLFRQWKLSKESLFVYLALHAFRDDELQPAAEDLARMCGIGNTKVLNALHELEACKFVTGERTGGRSVPTTYHLELPKHLISKPEILPRQKQGKHTPKSKLPSANHELLSGSSESQESELLSGSSNLKSELLSGSSKQSRTSSGKFAVPAERPTEPDSPVHYSSPTELRKKKNKEKNKNPGALRKGAESGVTKTDLVGQIRGLYSKHTALDNIRGLVSRLLRLYKPEQVLPLVEYYQQRTHAYDSVLNWKPAHTQQWVQQVAESVIATEEGEFIIDPLWEPQRRPFGA